MKKLTPIIILSVLFLSCGDSQKEYNNNDIIENVNGIWTEKFSDKPITGKVYGLFGENKPYKKVYQGNIRNGRMEGKWVNYFHSTGKKKWEGTVKDGKPDGLHFRWYENGKKSYEGTYKNGELISQKRWNEDGSVKK